MGKLSFWLQWRSTWFGLVERATFFSSVLSEFIILIEIIGVQLFVQRTQIESEFLFYFASSASAVWRCSNDWIPAAGERIFWYGFLFASFERRERTGSCNRKWLISNDSQDGIITLKSYRKLVMFNKEKDVEESQWSPISIWFQSEAVKSINAEGLFKNKFRVKLLWIDPFSGWQLADAAQNKLFK